MAARGWDELDVLIVTGDAYVDHPAFGPVPHRALPRGARLPRRDRSRSRDWHDTGRHRCAWARRGSSSGITRGQPRLDAQQAHRAEEGALRGPVLARRAHRPAPEPRHASSTRTSAGRRSPGCPSCSAASRRRCGASRTTTTGATQVRRSILLDAKADLLVFGMGERPAWEIARAARRRASASTQLTRRARHRARAARTGASGSRLPQTRAAYVTDGKPVRPAVVRGGRRRQGGLRARCRARSSTRPTRTTRARSSSRTATRRSTSTRRRCPLETRARWTGSTTCPSRASRTPRYDASAIPAYETVKHSIVTMRGCFGGCTFCSITEHEGRIIQSRIGRERAARGARALAHGRLPRHDHRPRRPDRQHVQDDVQGRARPRRACRRLSCVHPGICENLVTDHGPLIELMKTVREEPGVKQASSSRAACATTSPSAARSSSRELAQHHTGGQLSVAPEHNEPDVLDKMKKPPHRELRALRAAVLPGERGGGQGAVPRAVLHHAGTRARR